jgi:hypothetical protein
MPASTYSEYKDPETGETICWIPQLFPYATNTGEITSTEIESWLNTDIVFRELYESDQQNIQKTQEIHRRLQNGENVQISELPVKPWALTEYLLKNKARLYGENVLIKIFSKLVDLDYDVVWLSYVKEAISAISTQDPGAIHFFIARNVLKDKYGIEDNKAIDVLSREFINTLHKISNFKSIKHEVFNKNPIDLKDLESHFTNKSEDILELDEDFILFLKNIGKKGEELSIKVKENSKAVFQEYKNQYYSTDYRRNVWGLWLPPIQSDQDYKKLLSPFMIVLTQALWEDKCFKLWYRETNGSASIVKPIIEKIIPLLGPKKSKKFIEKDGHIILCNQEGEPLLTAPAIDANMIAPFKNGIKELGTLTGHKMLRWQVKSGFERWVNGENDPRLIEIDGGYSRIAEAIGCCNPREIAKVRDILHAQAHGYFKFADGSRGNMIILNILNRYQNTEPSKIRIILGDMLLPTYVHQIERSERRLIPIGDIPPLSGGSPDTYAAQAQLQLLVFCEFSNQSIRLAQKGSVLLPPEWWREKAVEAGLNPEKIPSIIEHWRQPDFLNCFLERQGDEYRLASYYDRQQKFLENQGIGRIKNSEKGKKSVERRNAKKLKKS